LNYIREIEINTYNLPRMNHEELNRPITDNEIESVIKKPPSKKSPSWMTSL
jgi:hypothetical protein